MWEVLWRFSTSLITAPGRRRSFNAVIRAAASQIHYDRFPSTRVITNLQALKRPHHSRENGAKYERNGGAAIQSFTGARARESEAMRMESEALRKTKDVTIVYNKEYSALDFARQVAFRTKRHS
jgi:hypothetical protein